ncbi:MAG TPA: ORF6N domain-containing protein [Flavobacteriaceae bacterium]|nr:ORF6N domain-containing protein [Flavobacteriaceae bacterium]
MQLQLIQEKNHHLRGERVMLDFDLAEMYGVETRVLKQAVRRNEERFPVDFMFQLTDKEINNLVSQFVIPSKSKFGGAIPFAFTEQGVAMLSSVLNSKKAVQVNIAIIRAFVLLRQNLSDYGELKEAIHALEKEMNTKFKDINQALHYLLNKDHLQTEQLQRKRIGFKK